MDRETYHGKSSVGQCNSYRQNEKGKSEQCDDEGVRRYDNGLDSGIHCDECWGKMLSDCRKRSW